MSLELRSIVAPGDLAKERLTLRAKADLDLGDYLVAQHSYVDGEPTTEILHTYWFPFKKIEKGDLVVIYTKEGGSKIRPLSTGKKAHFYYLDLENTIWDEVDVGALVLFAPKWESTLADELKS